MNIFQVLYYGSLDVPFVKVKNQHRFDNFILNFKMTSGTLLVTFILISGYYYSPFSYELLRDRNKEKTYVEIGIQKVVDLIKGKTITYSTK